MSFIQTVHASEEATTEAPAGQSVAASLGLNAQLFVFQLINFAIVAVILWFLILKPLTKKLAERKKIIDDSLDKAKEIDANLIMAGQKFQERIDEAKVEANKIIEKSHTQAEQLSAEMKVKAKKEIETLVMQARVKIQDEKEEVMRGIKEETSNLVVAVVEKILNEKMNDKKDKELIEESLKGMNK